MKILPYCLIVILSGLLYACGAGNSTTSDADSSKNSGVKLVSVETLDNFDQSFVGKVADKPVQINLRRYGKEISGVYWQKDSNQEYTLKGSMEGENFKLEAFDADNKQVGALSGALGAGNELKGKWDSGQPKSPFVLQKLDDNQGLNLVLDPIKVERNSGQGARVILISYPQLSGIHDPSIAQKVNHWIEDYFHESTKLKDVEDKSQNFKEDVKYDITYFGKEVISICKHHNLSKDHNTQLFDDSHGINLNFKRAKMYELQDFFKPNGLDELNKILLEKINKACGSSLDEKLLEACKLKLNEKTSFSLGKDKMTFHLTERLPYKLRGCGYVRIEYKDLQHLFNPAGPLTDVVKAIKM